MSHDYGIQLHDVLLSLNGESVEAQDAEELMQIINSAPRPVQLTFQRAVINNDPEPSRMERLSDFLSRPRPSVDGLEGMKAAMLTAGTRSPTLTVQNVPDGSEKASLIVTWSTCPAADSYQLQYSRDWPVKVWRTSVAMSKETDDVFESEITDLECGKGYVARVRCGIDDRIWGSYSSISSPATTAVPKGGLKRKSFKVALHEGAIRTANLLSPRSQGGGDLPQEDARHLCPTVELSVDDPGRSIIVTWNASKRSEYDVRFARDIAGLKRWKTWDKVTADRTGKISCTIQDLRPGKAYAIKVSPAGADHFKDPLLSITTFDPEAETREPILQKAMRHVQDKLNPVEYDVTFEDEKLGLELEETREKNIRVFSFAKSLPAEASGKIRVGDIITGVNDINLESTSIEEATEQIKNAPSPRTLRFARNGLLSPRLSNFLLKRNNNIE